MFGLDFNKKRETYIDYSKKFESREMIDFIESLLTIEQLKKLELSGLGETFSFKDRMLILYGHMYPLFSLEECKEKIQEIIEGYAPLFDKGIEFHMNEELIRRLGYLFSFSKPFYFDDES